MDAFLTYDQVQYWRILSTLKGWGISDKIKGGLADALYNLNPSFRSGSEDLIFWTVINKTGTFAISEMKYNGRKFGEGTIHTNHVIATHSRLIFGKASELQQVPYSKILDVTSEGGKFRVNVARESGLEFNTRFPKPSRLGSFLQMAGPSEQRLFVNSVERQKAEVGSEFVSYFGGFFAEIARQNRG